MDRLTAYYSVTTPRFHLQAKDGQSQEAKHKKYLQAMASPSLRHQPADLPLHASSKPEPSEHLVSKAYYHQLGVLESRTHFSPFVSGYCVI